MPRIARRLRIGRLPLPPDHGRGRYAAGQPSHCAGAAGRRSAWPKKASRHARQLVRAVGRQPVRPALRQDPPPLLPPTRHRQHRRPPACPHIPGRQVHPHPQRSAPTTDGGEGPPVIASADPALEALAPAGTLDLAALCERYGSAPALRWRGHTVSYREYAHRTARTAAALAAAGVTANHRIALPADLDPPTWAATLFAVLATGAVAVLLPSRAAPRERQRLLERTGAVEWRPPPASASPRQRPPRCASPSTGPPPWCSPPVPPGKPRR